MNKVSQLSSEQRQQLIERSKEILGRSNYYKLVDTIGVDALLEQILSFIIEKPPEEKKVKKWFKKTVRGLVWGCLFLVFFIALNGGFGVVIAVVSGVVCIVYGFINLNKEGRELFWKYTFGLGMLGLIIGGVAGAFFPYLVGGSRRPAGFLHSGYWSAQVTVDPCWHGPSAGLARNGIQAALTVFLLFDTLFLRMRENDYFFIKEAGYGIFRSFEA